MMRGVDMTPYVDLASSRRPGLEIQRVNVDFPKWIIVKWTARPSDWG